MGNLNLQKVIKSFSNLKVLVIGEAILDCYLSGLSNRLCHEAPVPIVDIKKEESAPGGAANTAVNAKKLGAEVTFLSVVGRDWEAKKLLSLLKALRINVHYVSLDQNRQTLIKRRVLSNNQLLVRFDSGTTEPVSILVEKELIKSLTKAYKWSDVVIISDYGYGIFTPKIIAVLEGLHKDRPKVLAIDAKKLPLYQKIQASFAKPNYKESLALLGTKQVDRGKRAEQVLGFQDNYFRLINSEIIAVTLDTEGAVVFGQNGISYRTYAMPAEDSKAAGAGDTYLAAFALSFGSKASLQEAAEVAATASALIVKKEGTATCSQKELLDWFDIHPKYVQENRLAELIKQYRKEGKVIVTTNGCFDILHSGHISYLKQAKALGDVLIVGINSDESIRKLKGLGRPVNHLTERVQVLAGLDSVDHVVSFSQDTPVKILKIIQPDVHVKGGDYKQSIKTSIENKFSSFAYKKDTLPEIPIVERFGGKLIILPFVKDYSTTSIINKIKSLE